MSPPACTCQVTAAPPCAVCLQLQCRGTCREAAVWALTLPHTSQHTTHNEAQRIVCTTTLGPHHPCEHAGVRQQPGGLPPGAGPAAPPHGRLLHRLTAHIHVVCTGGGLLTHPCRTCAYVLPHAETRACPLCGRVMTAFTAILVEVIEGCCTVPAVDTHSLTKPPGLHMPTHR